MRQVSSAHTAAWLSGDYTGSRRPMMRATLQVMQLGTVAHGDDVYAQYLFGQAFVPTELPNVKSVAYDRHVDTDAATCRIELYNTEPLPLGTPVTADDFGNYIYDQPGFFTYNRGMNTFTNRWHHTTNQWQRLLAPDRLIRTYEGYGFDASVGPDLDAHMLQSGVWMIDEVIYDANGLITLECRDAGRLLIDQLIFPPVLPTSRYPMSMTAEYPVPNVAGVSGSTTWQTPVYDTDSSSVHPGGPNLAIFGHRASELFDDNAATYWESVGYPNPDKPYAYEWVQGTFTSRSLNAVKVVTRGGPYTVYVSVWTTDGGVAARWGGGANIPYDPATSSSPNGANIRYVHAYQCAANTTTYLPFGDTLTGCTKVRLTFHHLYNTHQYDAGFPRNPYRAAAVSAQVSSNYATTTGTGTHPEGDYNEYTQIVKRLLAYGGFHWPNDAALAYLTASDGTHVATLPGGDDSYLGSGRVWGDMMDTGTAGVPGSILDARVWDKKSLMDGIAYVRDIVGFNFFVDETGGAVFRSPNVWQIGNYVGDAGSGVAYVTGSSDMVVIDENETLLTLSVRLSSRNQRDRVFIAGTSGQVGATAAGHTGPQGPFDSRLRRVGGWTDQGFLTNGECQIMADLISLRQLFSYRTDRLTIPGYSKIQIDDQVRIIEGTTSEDFIHYVNGISSTWDIETGVWTYALDTHWLGEAPFTDWVFDPATLSADTQAFLEANGSI